jgi:hypothetical protein
MAFSFSTFLAVSSLLVLCACGGKEGAANHPHPHLAPRIHRFEATPPLIEPGATTLLVMEFGPGHGEVDHGVGPVKSGQPVVVSPVKDTTYTLTVRMAQAGAGWKAQGAKEGGLKHEDLKGEAISRSVVVKVFPPVPPVPGR